MSQVAAAHQEIATRNSRAAVVFSEETRHVLTERILSMEKAFNALAAQMAQLEQKYNLLLTKHFSGGSTSGQ